MENRGPEDADLSKKNETLMGPLLSDGSVTQVPSTSQFPL